MNKNAFCAAYCLSIMISAQVAVAEEPGFGGDLILGGVWETGRPSQLDAVDGNKTITSLNRRSKSESDADLYFSGEVRYTLANEKTTFFLSDIRDDENALSAGVQHSLGDWGTLSGAVTYGINEVWKNPYLVGTPRRRTDEASYGLAFDYDNVMGSGLLLSTEFAVVDVDNDVIGKQQKLLRRDGYRGKVSAGYEIPFSENIMVVPSINYTRHQLDGDANSSDSYGIAMALLWSRDNLSIETVAELGKTNYHDDHPVYNRERDATSFDVSALVSYYEPFGLSQTSVYAFAGYSRVDENIDFFDTNTFTTGFGVGYHF